MQELDRRQFLARAAWLGAATAAGGLVLGSTSCSKKESTPQCNDVSGLQPAQRTIRQTLQYVDNTTNPEQDCENCALYVAAEAGSSCGTCTSVPGPISPRGWCAAWVPIEG